MLAHGTITHPKHGFMGGGGTWGTVQTGGVPNSIVERDTGRAVCNRNRNRNPTACVCSPKVPKPSWCLPATGRTNDLFGSWQLDLVCQCLRFLTLHRRRSPAACLPGQEQVPGKSKPKCCCKYSVKKLRFRPHFSSLRGEGGVERHPPTKETATTTSSWKCTCIHYFRDLEKLMPKLSQRHTTTSTKNWEKAREEKTKFINAV